MESAENDVAKRLSYKKEVFVRGKDNLEIPIRNWLWVKLRMQTTTGSGYTKQRLFGRSGNVGP
jgi:hypothetical protein